jgi:hypothetical protein
MSLKLSGVFLSCSGIALCFMVTAHCRAQSNQKGSRMFGFLVGNKAAVSMVAPEVGGTLQPQSTLPQQLSPPAKPSFPQCQLTLIRGNPPDVRWVADEVPGETRHVFRLPSTGATPSLAILSSRDARQQKQVQVWELSAEKPARFVRQRQIVLGPEQSPSAYSFPEAVVCLPGQQAALAVGFENPSPRNALFIYDTANNRFRHVDLIEPEYSNAPPLTFFESMSPTPKTLLLLYHTKAIRVAADNYAYENDHILLFSRYFPQGLEIVRLAIADGNVHSWGMLGKTLWLQTADKRKKSQEFIWTLDLSRVL